MTEGEKSFSLSPGAGGAYNVSGVPSMPLSPNTTLNRRALSLDASNPFDSDSKNTLTNAQPVQVSSIMSQSEPSFSNRKRSERYHQKQSVRGPFIRSRSRSQCYTDQIRSCWNDGSEGNHITSPNFNVKDEFRSGDSEVTVIREKAMDEKIEQELELIIDQMIQKEEERFGELEVEQTEMKKQTQYINFMRQCASVAGCYVIILITGALKRTFMKRSMSPDGTLGYNIWFVLMLKDTLCFVTIIVVRIVQHFVNKQNSRDNNNLYLSCFTNTTAFFVAIPGATLVVAFEYLAFMAMARLDINTFILLMDTTIIFIVVFRGMCLFIIPDRCQFALIIAIVVGIIGFRVSSTDSSVNVTDFLGSGAWICISASLVGGLSVVFWEWFYHRTEIRFFQLCTLSMTMQFIVTLLICLLANYGHYSEMNIGFSANVLMLISSQVAMNLCTHYAIAKTNSVANELIIQVAFISIAAIMIAIDNKAFTAPMSVSMFITFICITAYLIIDYYRSKDRQTQELQERQESINRKRASLLANGSSLLPAEFQQDTKQGTECGDETPCDNSHGDAYTTGNLPSVFLDNERAYDTEGFDPIQMNAYDDIVRVNDQKIQYRSPSLRI